MIKLGFFLILLGLALCLDIHPGAAVPGGIIFQLSKEEISKEKDLFPGINMAIKKLNAKNERKENKFR